MGLGSTLPCNYEETTIKGGAGDDHKIIDVHTSTTVGRILVACIPRMAL